jgi:hypothetical protein
MADAPNFAKLVPGFDFLQSLVKNAGAAMPGIGQWVAPTLNPEELEKRIGELKTVQFWLEQNARMLGATIQALEVQRMTLSTLKTMNVQMTDLRDSLQIRLPAAAPAAEADAAAPAPGDDADRAAAPAPAKARKATSKSDAAKAGAPKNDGTPPAVDPLQWWGALTKQFTELAANAMKETTTEAAKNLAGNGMKQSIQAAGDTLKKAMPGGAPARRPAGKRAGAKRPG